MKVLLYDFSSFTLIDVRAALERLGIEHRVIVYPAANPEHTPYLEQCVSEFIDSYCPDAVLSINFTPIIAMICADRGLPYIAWSYDSPNPVWKMERYLGYDTNYVFLFDRAEVDYYRSLGVSHLWHMPCAVDMERIDRTLAEPIDHDRFDSDVSMVGRLYKSSDLEVLCKDTSPYIRGYIMGAIDAQMGHYGKYVLGDMEVPITDMLNDYFRNAGMDRVLSPFIVRARLSAYVTRMERLGILGEMADRYQTVLWSNDRDDYLTDRIEYRGHVMYFTEMPQAFHCSKVNLNISLKSIRTGIPLRALDIMSCGGFLLSNYQEELQDYIGDGVGCAIYHDLGEAVEKAGYYLAHDEERNRIAARGRELTREYFGYDDALRRMFRIAGFRV